MRLKAYLPIALLACADSLWLATAPAAAQQTAKVVATCGTQTYTTGSTNYVTIDTGGGSCGPTSPAPGVVTGNQSNAGAGTTGSANVGVMGYNYYWTGAAWAQWTGAVALSAGSQIAGKFGIDQTTPGTTNGVATAISAVTGSVSAATITNSSTQAVAAASRKLLVIDNESATASIACAFGATAALNTAGSFTIPPQNTRVWNSYPVPADAVNCISSVASSPATIEAN